MNELLPLLLSGIAGAALGVGFFGGLLWTIRRSMASPQPALWLFCSGLLRMGVTLAGFYFVSAHHWQRLLVCLGGFMLARAVVMRFTRSLAESSNRLAAKASHAP